MESASPPKSKSPRRIRLIIGISVIVVAAGALLWLGFGRGTVYYYSVAELLDKGSVRNVRVAGDLEEGSVGELGEGGHTFAIRDREQQMVELTVVYDGALPDAFKNEPGTEIVAEGDFDGAGTFTARVLISKCPSKYEAAP
jgi:cytochrome c-type biogenesis protein CcmE